MNWWIDDHPRNYGNINPVTWPCAHSADWKLWENPKSTGASAYSPNENSLGYPPCSHPSRTSDQNHPHSGIEPKSSWPFFLGNIHFSDLCWLESYPKYHTKFTVILGPIIQASAKPAGWNALFLHPAQIKIHIMCIYIYIYILCIYIYT